MGESQQDEAGTESGSEATRVMLVKGQFENEDNENDNSEVLKDVTELMDNDNLGTVLKYLVAHSVTQYISISGRHTCPSRFCDNE